MKQLTSILLTVFIIVLGIQTSKAAKSPDFAELWKEYQTFENKGFNKDALNLAQKIYDQSVEKNRVDQQFKALIHIYKNKTIIDENSEEKIVADLKESIKNSKSTDEKALLKVLLAHAYTSYYTHQQYKIINRTYSQELSENFTFWDAKQFKEQIDILYQSALSDSDHLKNFPLNEYSDILISHNNQDIYQVPFESLLDLLYYEAIKYYSSNAIRLTEASDQFEINQPVYFSPAEEFSNFKIDTKDGSSLLSTIQLLQDWTKIHLGQKDKELSAFIDYTRLNFVHEQYVGEQKNKLFADNLDYAFKFYKHPASKALFKSKLIQLWNDHEDTFGFSPVQIVQQAQKLVQDYPKTYGAKTMQSLIDRLHVRVLNVTVEEAVSPQQAFKTLIDYKNISKVSFKIVEWEATDTQYNTNLVENTWKEIKKQKTIRSGEFHLPSSQDLMQHSIEFPIQPLPVGKYTLVVYTDDIEKDIQKGKFTTTTFYVTNLSVLLRERTENFTISIKDRITGKPIQQAQVEVFINQTTSDDRSIMTAHTDMNGEVSLPKGKLGQRTSYYIKTKKGQDEYQSSSQYYYNYNYVEQKHNWHSRVHIYTDRGIYKPGQQLFFKGIAIESKLDSIRPATKRNIELKLLDANYQVVQTQNFITNEFGSFSGFFRIPEGGLNGVFTLQTNFGSRNVHIEEYKRPTFQVKTLPIEGNFQLNDTIKVLGKAVSYSGSNISNAKVNYIVQRKVYRPIWRNYYRSIWPPYASQPTVVVHGTTQTDENGDFTINFIAEPDRYKNDIYQYEISVEVQDITGEVRTTTTQIKVGKNGVLPNMQVDAVWRPLKGSKLVVSSKNLQDKPVTSIFNMKIESLETPQHPKKSRYWSEPDQFSMTFDQHHQLFPYDLYKDDISASNWRVGASVWTNKITVEGDTTLDILPKDLAQGMYKLSAYVLDREDTIHLEHIFEVKAPLDPSVTPDFIKVVTNADTYHPNDLLEISFASDLNQAYIYAFITHKNETLKDTLIHLSQQPISWKMLITEEMRGNVILHYEIVAQNRNHSGNKVIKIPYEQPAQLTYQWKTFRDKLLPGSQEKWSLVIYDKDSLLADAELLVAMYDQSLDQFVSHDYQFSISHPISYGYGRMNNTSLSFKRAHTLNFVGNKFNPYSRYSSLQYPALNYFGWNLSPYWYHYRYTLHSKQSMAAGAPLMKTESNVLSNEVASDVVVEDNVVEDNLQPQSDEMGEVTIIEDNTTEAQSIPLRSNFNETAFFYPQLRKGLDGTYSIEFEIPEALTQWKLLALAHTKDLEHLIFKEEVVTQKDVMVQLSQPRFVRMGDEIYLKAKISNLTDDRLDANVELVFRDAKNNLVITDDIIKTDTKRNVQVNAQSNSSVEWFLIIPKEYEGLIYEITVSAGDQVDGERGIIPVLENRILITESYPFFFRGKGKQDLPIKDFINKSATSEVKSVTFEYTSQPVWLALMALPYLNEQKGASSTALFNRYYSQTLSKHILKSIPNIKKLLEVWRKEGALESALEKNEDLKSVLIEATPWLREAQSETEQMQQLVKLFDDAHNYNGRKQLVHQLKQLQTASGGFSWYPGMPANRSITQNFVLGFYQLQNLGALEISEDKEISILINKAIQYLENEVTKNYEEIKHRDSNYAKTDHLGYLNIQYLWLISHLPNKQLTDAEKYFYAQAQQHAFKKNNYAKAAIALALYRRGDKNTPQDILYSFKQSAVMSDKLGMYWKTSSYYHWYQAPIETQAMIIQAFKEISNETEVIDELKIWLLTQKQTNRWEQTKATADACYALLLTGSDWKASNRKDKIKYDNTKVDSKDFSPSIGYLKTTWTGDKLTSIPEHIKIKKRTKNPSWGAVYYQYWEDIDKVQSSTKDLHVKRTLYKVINSKTGEELIPITTTTPLELGDKVRIKLELKFDRDMEFFHIQDTRGSGFEPVNVLSQYKYQNGIGYYEETGDAATHFYMDFVKKGNFIFEYTVYVSIAGNYSSGLTIGESLYAPEFRFQSDGSRVNIRK